jgi:hypothetical protein
MIVLGRMEDFSIILVYLYHLLNLDNMNRKLINNHRKQS